MPVKKNNNNNKKKRGGSSFRLDLIYILFSRCTHKPFGECVSISYFQIAQIHFVCRPKFFIGIVFNFSSDDYLSQEKLKTILMQNFGRQTKCIMKRSQECVPCCWGDHPQQLSMSSCKGNDTFKRRIREAIEIRCQTPIMNRDNGYELLAIYVDVLSRGFHHPKSRDKTSNTSGNWKLEPQKPRFSIFV